MVNAAGGAAIDPGEYKKLQTYVRKLTVEEVTLDKFKHIYQTYEGAPKMLKTILGETGYQIQEKSRRLGELRKFFDWTIQGEYARDHNTTIENTNQGKDKAARSDLDATANMLEMEAGGKLKLREGGVKGLQKYHRDRYKGYGFKGGSETVDVSLFNGDPWLPDWRDIHLGNQEFNHRLMRNVIEIRSTPGAYFVPGAHREQAHDRALAEGHTIHIGWDFVNNMPSVNGLPIIYDAETGRVVQLEVDPKTGKIGNPPKKITLVEYSTREAAKAGIVRRYEGVSELHSAERWRRSFGNLIQNWYEALLQNEPISRNKYFIERIVDQAINRVANVNGTYVELESSAAEPALKEKWKKVFIERAFGAKEGSPRFEEIKSVLDRSARIQIDYKAERGYNENAKTYYAEEIREVREAQAKLGPESARLSETEILKQAEAKFVAKQRHITIEGGLKVIEHTFRMELTPEGLRRAKRGFSTPELARRIVQERGVELALFFDMIETAPLEPVERWRLRQRIMEAIPHKARPLALRMAELARLKMDLIGRPDTRKAIAGERSYVPASEIFAEAEAGIKKLLGNVETTPLASRGELLRYIDQTIALSLGPVEAAEYRKAIEVSARGARLKYAGLAYWTEMKAHADMLWGTMAALAMVNSYQHHCAGQISWNQDCLGALAHESFIQTLFLMPYINTGMILKDGAQAMGRGELLHGAAGLGLGLASVPMIAESIGITGAVAIKVYVLIMTAKLGKAVTYDYAVQLMESDYIEQAFKAEPEPGKQAAPYEYRNRPTIFRSDPPTFPILSDVIKVEADRWSVNRRGRVARGMFSADIQADLLEMGIDPASRDWDRQARILARTEYGALVPYTQRTARIYETFSPKIEAWLNELRPGNPDLAQDYAGVDVCMEVRVKTISDRYEEPPGIWQQLRFWANRGKEREIEIASAMGRCVALSAKEDHEFLWVIFEDYVDSWFAQQSFGYQLGSKTPGRRDALIRALINEYVVHRYLAERTEKSTLMQEAKEQAGRQVRRRGKVMSAMMTEEKDSREKLGESIKSFYQAAEGTLAESDVVPEIKLAPPVTAVRLGKEVPIDFKAKGRYVSADGSMISEDDWQGSLQSQVTSVTLAEPENLLRLTELEEELAGGRGPEAKQFVTIEETLTGELRDGSGAVLASQQAVVTHFDVLEWRGDVTVEVRSAGPDTEDASDPEQTFPYDGAPITISGPTSAEGVSKLGLTGNWARAFFSDLKAGSYSIKVNPWEGDERHSDGEGEIELVDYTVALGATLAEDSKLQALTIRPCPSCYTLLEVGRSSTAASDVEETKPYLVLVTWKDRDSVTVVLPYKAPPEESENTDDSGDTGGSGDAGMDDLLEAMRRARTSANIAGGEATGACAEAERQATETQVSVTALGGQIVAAGGQVDRIEGWGNDLADDLSRAQAALIRAQTTLGELAKLRDRAAKLRDEACDKASRIAGAASQTERDQLLADVRAAVRELEGFGPQADLLMDQIREDVTQILLLADSAKALLAEISSLGDNLAGLQEPAQTVREDIAEARAETDSAEVSVGEVRTSRGRGAEILEEGSARASAETAGSEASEILRQLGTLFGVIETTLQGVARCPEVAGRTVAPVEQAVTQARTDIDLLNERLAGVDAALTASGILGQIKSVAAEAEGLIVLAGAFTSSIHNRVDHAATCAAQAEAEVLKPAKITVPDLKGKSESLAVSWLSELDLRPVVINGSIVEVGQTPDTVENQSPLFGGIVAAGDPVTLWIFRKAAAEAPAAPATSTQADCDRQWPGTILMPAGVGKSQCKCPSGSQWSPVEKRCRSLSRPGEGGSTVADCSDKPGTIRDFNTGQCICPAGEWDTMSRRCIDRVAEDREREIEEGIKGAECENLYSQIEVFRENPDRFSQQMADRAEREARAKGCDPTRISDAVAAGGGGGGSGGDDGTPVPVTEPVDDKDEGETRISTRSIRACVTDINDVLDDQYDLIVNGRFVGAVAHPEGGATCYNAMLRSGPNRLELRLVATRGKGTYLLFSINDGEFSANFGGSVNHIWSVIAP